MQPMPDHPRFPPDALLREFTAQRGGMDSFFCRGLIHKSPEAKIMAAAAQNRAEDVKELIAAHSGITPDFTNSLGVSPLMVAAARGHTAVIEVLANHPLVDLSQATADGWTALHYAALFNQTAAIETLLRRQADPLRANGQGTIAYDLTDSPAAKDAFRRNKEFARYLKRRTPAAQNDNSPPAAGKEKLAEKAPGSLSALFMQATLNIGLSATPEAICRSLQKDIAAGNSQTLRESYDVIMQAETAAFQRGQSISFDWDKLFITAAQHGNLPALSFIVEKRGFLDSKPLTDALRAAIGTGGTADPDVVHWLLRWGADANASSKAISSDGSTLSATLGYAAFALERTAAFEQICLWGGDLKSWRMKQVQLNWEMRVKHAMAGGEETSFGQMMAARASVNLLRLRRDYANAGEGKIQSDFKTAVQNKDLPAVMAIYAESRMQRIMRGRINLPKDLGAQAMALALREGKTTFATRLAADGHHIKHLHDKDLLAAMQTLENGQASPVRDFLAAHKNGSLFLPPNSSVSEKFKELRAEAMRSVPSGRGYGI